MYFFTINAIIFDELVKKIGRHHIKPIATNRSWHRHICEASFLVSVSIIGLYIWGYISGNPNVSSPFVVGIIPASISAFTAILSIISYIWVPKKPILLSLFIYLLVLSVAALLVTQTGNTESPFVAVWTLISLFACIFGAWGLVPVFLAVCVFTSFQYLADSSLSTESIIIIISGGVLPLLASMIIWRRSPGKLAETHATTVKKRPNDELGEMTAKSEVIINAIGDGIMAIDNLGIIKLFNPAAQDIIGWKSHDATSLNYKSVLKLIDKNEKPLEQHNDPIAQVLNLNQQIRTNDLGLETKSGKKILVSLVVSPIGNIGSGVIVVFHDITKEKAEEREQAEFISTASHEMRTPVASIEGYIGLAMNPHTAQIDIRAREYLNKAHQSTQNLGHLFQDLLDISKADDGRLPNNPKPVNIVDFTQNIVQDFKKKATEKGLRLIFKPLPDDAGSIKHIVPDYNVNLDNSHIYEILNNLIENAIKYTKKGDIVVDVVGSEDHVVISVQDSGIGISAEDMPHLFQKFYRIDNNETRDIGGTGLGLYLCRRLAETLGGRIWAESTLGLGSKFFVKLPRTSSQKIKPIEQVAAPLMQETSAPPIAATQSQQTIPTQAPPKQAMDIVRPANNVPRGQALTPQQIANYVAQQHALASQQPQTAVQAAQTQQTVQAPLQEPVITPQPIQTMQQQQPPIQRQNTNNRSQSFNIPRRE